MSSSLEAIVRLLGDDDQETVQLTMRQLASQGASAVATLQPLLNSDNKIVSQRVQEIISNIEYQEASSAFYDICVKNSDFFDLEEALFFISIILDPKFSNDASREKLERWGKELKEALKEKVSEIEKIETMAAFISQDLKFRANTNNYYHPHNSFLPRVIENRMGIPLTLTLIYMLLGKRAGVEIGGVNLPGHFIGRLGNVFFDPFHGGRIIDVSDCEAILSRQGIVFDPAHLAPANPRMIVLRTLTNLRNIFTSRGNIQQQDLVESWMDLMAQNYIPPTTDEL